MSALTDIGINGDDSHPSHSREEVNVNVNLNNDLAPPVPATANAEYLQALSTRVIANHNGTNTDTNTTLAPSPTSSPAAPTANNDDKELTSKGTPLYLQLFFALCLIIALVCLYSTLSEIFLWRKKRQQARDEEHHMNRHGWGLSSTGERVETDREFEGLARSSRMMEIAGGRWMDTGGANEGKERKKHKEHMRRVARSTRSTTTLPPYRQTDLEGQGRALPTYSEVELQTMGIAKLEVARTR